MDREIRMVPPGWQHPTKLVEDWQTGKPKSCFKPLMNGPWSEHVSSWDEENAQWDRGFEKSYTEYPAFQWKPKRPDRPATFAEWDGPRPKQEDYMPEFEPGTATHLMMYEITSEGTPISPAFATPEELDRWLVDNQVEEEND
jgi:hypothetical protein